MPKVYQKYEGIYRRHQILGQKMEFLIDDYAHNPAKCQKVLRLVNLWQRKWWFVSTAWLGPTRFLRQDFVEEISNTLRENDEIWMSEIFTLAELL